MTATPGWRSGWVNGATGISLTPAASPWPGVTAGADVTQLVGLALRDNPRRAFLLVSRVLGKHVPVAPQRATAAAIDLAGRVRRQLGDTAVPSLVLGFAETATGLGHAVAVTLGAPYLHSTRRPGDAPVSLAFDEAHSHARGHVVCPSDPALLRGDGPVVLVDDELSTGRTALNTIAALQAVHARGRYLVAALIDVRTPADEHLLAADAAALGVEVAWVALGRGLLHVPDDAVERALAARAASTGSVHPAAVPDDPPPSAAQITHLPVSWPAGVREGGRRGITPDGSEALDAATAGVAGDLTAAVRSRGAGSSRAHPDAAAAARVLVLGTEELLHAPMRIAAHLQAAGLAVWFSSTTRSPAVVVGDEEYALRDRITFTAHDLADGERAERYAYNVARSPDGRPWSDVVVVVDSAGDTPALQGRDGLLQRLATLAPAVWVVVLPVTP